MIIVRLSMPARLWSGGTEAIWDTGVVLGGCFGPDFLFQTR